jgi:DNA-binding GntR family transcriptional regulator
MAKATKKDRTEAMPMSEAGGPRFPAASLGQLQLSESVAMQLREQIISGRLKKGEFLRIDAIAKALGVSTTPVREGLLLLQSEAFVRLIPRRGFMVNSFSKDDLLDLFWAQAVVGGELAARAATRMSAADVERLAELHGDHVDAFVAKDPVVAKIGHNFHRTINLAADSPRLALLLGSLTRQLPNRFYASIEGQLKDAIDYHPLIIAALRAGDADAARSLMHRHILGGGEHLIEMLERQGMWAAEPGPKARPARAARR